MCTGICTGGWGIHLYVRACIHVRRHGYRHGYGHGYTHVCKHAHRQVCAENDDAVLKLILDNLLIPNIMNHWTVSVFVSKGSAIK